MKATNFKEANVNFAEGQDEYHTLPGLRRYDKNDTIITCYNLSIIERLRLLFMGRVWMCEMNFYRDLTPRYFSTKKNDVI